ncbi:MAG: pyruvate carboxyltransferase [Candidatus Eremiobacteraeota bacterium]|nr:pyruvate carboxyltransferase [Candidatus Eremiobacteraeota bacterium]
MKSILFSDTTLRDGEQMPGVCLSVEHKVRLAALLAAARVDSIEAGFPACGPDEIAAIRRICAEVQGVVVLAFARARRADIDRAWEALRDARPHRRGVSVSIGTSPIHRGKLRMSEPEVLAAIRDAVAYARQRFELIAFSPEDAPRTEPPFLAEVYRTAIAAGARVVGFPDTLGLLTPEKVRDAIAAIVPLLGQARLVVHFHNDLGLAVANTLAAVEAGAHGVQCTVNGIGERAGNAALEEVALALALNAEQYGRHVRLDLETLTELSREVADVTGIALTPHKAVVGRNVFATSAGIHQDGLLKDEATYLPFAPALVGGPGVRLVLGKHSGRAGIAARMRAQGFEPTPRAVEDVRRRLASVGALDESEERSFFETAAAEL